MFILTILILKKGNIVKIMKTCIKCKLDLLEENYSKGKNICKQCCSISYKEWRRKELLNASHRILPDKKTCTVCHVEFPITEFYIRTDRNKPISRCRKCNQKANKDSWNKLTEDERKKRFEENRLWRNKEINKGNLKVYMTSKLCGIKSRSIKNNLPFDLTIDYLIELFQSQNGKCYYTHNDINIQCNRGLGKNLISFPEHRYQASLDRLIPEKGYVKGNVVWCGWLINTCKNLLTEAEFYQVCETVLQCRKSLTPTVERSSPHTDDQTPVL